MDTVNTDLVYPQECHEHPYSKNVQQSGKSHT